MRLIYCLLHRCKRERWLDYPLLSLPLSLPPLSVYMYEVTLSSFSLIYSLELIMSLEGSLHTCLLFTVLPLILLLLPSLPPL